MLHICGITEICGVNDACVCLRWTKCAEMLKNAIAYADICDYIRIFANLCINKYSKCINIRNFENAIICGKICDCAFLQNMRNI